MAHSRSPRTRPRRKTPSGDSLRLQTRTLGVKRIRTMLRETARTLVVRTKSKDKMGRKQMAALDLTKGNPWRGKVTRDSSGENQELWILRYKGEGGPFFQWAVIKLVGHDVPLILDAVPVERGRKRADIVDDLLNGATDTVPGHDLVMMDREFANDGVKDACEEHDVHYLNSGVVWSSSDHAHQIAKLASEDKDSTSSSRNASTTGRRGRPSISRSASGNVRTRMTMART